VQVISAHPVSAERGIFRWPVAPDTRPASALPTGWTAALRAYLRQQQQSRCRNWIVSPDFVNFASPRHWGVFLGAGRISSRAGWLEACWSFADLLRDAVLRGVNVEIRGPKDPAGRRVAYFTGVAVACGRDAGDVAIYLPMPWAPVLRMADLRDLCLYIGAGRAGFMRSAASRHCR